jgi:hypothetical protein
MRKLITGLSIILILFSLYGLLKTVLDSRQSKSMPATAVVAAPAPSPNMAVASTTPTPDATAQSTPNSTPISTITLEPLKVRVVKHQPDQFRKGAINQEELSAIKKAIKNIAWSRNANPKAAASEDYASIVKECKKSGEHDLFTDLITEAVSNDYQPDNEVASSAYFTELNSDFESGNRSDRSNGKSTGETAAASGTSVELGLTPPVRQPAVLANATSSSAAPPPASAEAFRSKTCRARHRPMVRHGIVDAKMRLLALWHQSLAETAKSAKGIPISDSNAEETEK